MDETMLDGNAGAGDLQALFAVEVTQAVAVCESCGTEAPLAEAHVFSFAPGLTLRCRGCEAVLPSVMPSVHLTASKYIFWTSGSSQDSLVWPSVE